MAAVAMKAIVNDRYGPPEKLMLEERAIPTVGSDTVLIRVRAASVNPFDWHLMRGTPYIVRLVAGLRGPESGIPGVDAAGIVEAVGTTVTQFRAGDEVIGSCSATLAEFAAGNELDFVPKPAALTFEQAAAIPGAGVTALQALRAGRVGAGTRVLINGASGGVGTFAVQIANALGAHVTGVCSTANIDLVRSLGADEVVDYTAADFARAGETYDAIVDTVGNRRLGTLRRVLVPGGTLVVVAGGEGGRLIGGMARKLRAKLLNRVVSQTLVAFFARVTNDDLAAVLELVRSGEVTPVIDRTYPLAEAPAAIRYLETGRARGKVVISL